MQSGLASTPMVWAVPLIAAPTLGRDEHLCAGDQDATPIGPLAANLNVQTHVSCVLSGKWPEIRFCGIPLVWVREIKVIAFDRRDVRTGHRVRGLPCCCGGNFIRSLPIASFRRHFSRNSPQTCMDVQIASFFLSRSLLPSLGLASHSEMRAQASSAGTYNFNLKGRRARLT